MGKQTLANLKKRAGELKIKGRSGMSKEQLILAINIYETTTDERSRERQLMELMDPRGGGGGGGEMGPDEELGAYDRRVKREEKQKKTYERLKEGAGKEKKQIDQNLEDAMAGLTLSGRAEELQPRNALTRPDPMMPIQTPPARFVGSNIEEHMFRNLGISKKIQDFLRPGPHSLMKHALTHQPLADETAVQWKIMPGWADVSTKEDHPLTVRLRDEIVEANRRMIKTPPTSDRVEFTDGSYHRTNLVLPRHIRRGTRFYLNDHLWYDWGFHGGRGVPQDKRYEPTHTHKVGSSDPLVVLDRYQDYIVVQRYNKDGVTHRWNDLSEPFRIHHTHYDRLLNDYRGSTAFQEKPLTMEQEIELREKRGY